MSLVDEAGPGIWWPGWAQPNYNYSGQIIEFGTLGTMDAANEEVQFIGTVWIDGRASKTFGTAGSKIHILTGAVTWATALSSLQVGVQDVSAAAGPPGRGDGTFDVSETRAQGTGTAITANAWNTFTMAVGSDKTIAHGDRIAIVMKMLVRNGADSVVINGTAGASSGSNPSHGPLAVTVVGGTTAISGLLPIVVLEFDDGTLATIDGALQISSVMATAGFSNSSNPDEKALLFEVPTERKIDAYQIWIKDADLNSDFTIKVYSDPLGTPTAVSGSDLNYDGRWSIGNNVTRALTLTLPASVTLAANTLYALAVKATGSQIIGTQIMTLANANYRKFLTGGTSLRLGTRNDSSGAFSETTTQVPCFHMRCMSFHDGAGGAAGGGIRLAGHGGLAA